jgi:hypothetical protein
VVVSLWRRAIASPLVTKGETVHGRVETLLVVMPIRAVYALHSIMW